MKQGTEIWAWYDSGALEKAEDAVDKDTGMGWGTYWHWKACGYEQLINS